MRFAEEGAKIFAVDRNLESVTETVERVKATGGEIVTYQCDVTDAAAVAAMVKACLDQFGRIDVLVNNVGGSAHGGPVEMSEDVWDARVDYNLKRTAWCRDSCTRRSWRRAWPSSVPEATSRRC